MTMWANTEHTWEVTVDVVDPNNLENVRGQLRDVDLSQCSVTEGFDTDSRVQARIGTSVREFEDDGYIDKSRLRLTLAVPEWGWSRELVTGYVTDTELTLSQGFVNRRYTTDSVMWALGKDLIPWNVVCAKGQSMMEVTRWWLNVARMPFIEYGPNDKRYGEAKSYEIGDSLLSTLFDMNDGLNRLDMDGHGRVVIHPKPDPRAMSPIMTLDASDPLTLICSDLVRTSDEWDTVSRVIVTASGEGNGKERNTIAGYADAQPDWPSAPQIRGYNIGKKESYDGASEHPAIQELTDVARQKLWDEQATSITWTFTTLFCDLHIGDIVRLIPFSYERKCLITSVQTDLKDMTQKITCKEIW